MTLWKFKVFEQYFLNVMQRHETEFNLNISNILVSFDGIIKLNGVLTNIQNTPYELRKIYKNILSSVCNNYNTDIRYNNIHGDIINPVINVCLTKNRGIYDFVFEIKV